MLVKVLDSPSVCHSPPSSIATEILGSESSRLFPFTPVANFPLPALNQVSLLLPQQGCWFSWSAPSDRTGMLANLGCGVGVATGKKATNSYCSYPKISSFSWMCAFQFVVSFWSISRTLKWLFLTILSSFIAVLLQRGFVDFFTPLQPEVPLVF